MEDDTTRVASSGRARNRRWASAGSVIGASGPAGPSRPATTARARSSASCHAADHRVGVAAPDDRSAVSRRVTASANRPGSARTNSATSRSGSGHRPCGSTTTQWAPPPTARDTNPLTTLDTHGSPSRTMVSGRCASANRSDLKIPSAAPTVPGPVRRRPERGSARIGQPSAAAMSETASGLPHPAPARTSPRPPGRRTPPATRDRTHASSGSGSPPTTACQGAPSPRPAGTPPPAAGSPSNGSRKGRLTWTGPGPDGPERDSATIRAANDRHAPRPAAVGDTGVGEPTGRAPEEVELVDGLGRPHVAALGWPVGSADEQRHPGQIRLHHRGVELGGRRAAGGEDHGGSPGGQSHPEGGEPGRTLVQADVDGQAGMAGQGHGQRCGPRSRTHHGVGHPAPHPLVHQRGREGRLHVGMTGGGDPARYAHRGPL